MIEIVHAKILHLDHPSLVPVNEEKMRLGTRVKSTPNTFVSSPALALEAIGTRDEQIVLSKAKKVSLDCVIVIPAPCKPPIYTG